MHSDTTIIYVKFRITVESKEFLNKYKKISLDYKSGISII